MKVRNFHINIEEIARNAIRLHAKTLSELTGKKVTEARVVEMATVAFLGPLYPDLKKYFDLKSEMEERQRKENGSKEKRGARRK